MNNQYNIPGYVEKDIRIPNQTKSNILSNGSILKTYLSNDTSELIVVEDDGSKFALNPSQISDSIDENSYIICNNDRTITVSVDSSAVILFGTEGLAFNAGLVTAEGGTFTRSGSAHTIKDNGSLTNGAALNIVPGLGFIGTGHAWASTITGLNDHVNQANFTFDSSGVTMYNAVGNIANSDSTGSFCVFYASGAGLKIKNLLGYTATVGYSIDFYDDPAI